MNKKDIFKKQVFMIEAVPYEQQCVVVLNGTFKDAFNFLKRKNAKDEIFEHIEENKTDYFENKPDTNRGSLYNKLPFGFVMTIKVKNNWIDTTKVVTHECLHLTSYIMRRVGITLTEESEEAYTYLQESLVEKILKKIY